MEDLAGEPVLTRVMNRLYRAEKLDEIVVATTTEPSDEMIREYCASQGWPYFCGDENDVLDRYYQAAIQFSADIVVRITSDCPLIEPQIVDRTAGMILDLIDGTDYVSNTNPTRTFPRGLDTEAMTFDTLANVWREDDDPHGREHVTPYIYSHPELFRLHLVENEEDLSHHRWVVDTKEDLEFVRLIFEHFDGDDFDWTEVLSLLEDNPEWLEINRHIQQKTL